MRVSPLQNCLNRFIKWGWRFSVTSTDSALHLQQVLGYFVVFKGHLQVPKVAFTLGALMEHGISVVHGASVIRLQLSGRFHFLVSQ